MDFFFKRVWGFTPDTWPAISFPLKGPRDRLLKEWSPGDRVLLAATTGKPTDKHERGRLLGMAEIGQEAKETAELVDIVKKEQWRHSPFDVNGNFRFPFSVSIVKAWHFRNPPITKDILKDYYSRNGIHKLEGQDKARFMAFLEEHHEEIIEADAPKINALPHEENTPANLSPSRGPVPSFGERHYEVVARESGHVYWLQFGKRDIWKIGRSHSPQDRKNQINKNMPYKVTGEQWEIIRTQKTGSPAQAHDLEQKIIRRLRKSSIGGEMFHCSREEFEKAWEKIVIANATDNDK